MLCVSFYRGKLDIEIEFLKFIKEWACVDGLVDKMFSIEARKNEFHIHRTHTSRLARLAEHMTFWVQVGSCHPQTGMVETEFQPD